MLTLIQAILPVVMLLALGVWLRKAGVIDEPGRAACSRLIYRIGIPALLISKLSQRPIDEGFEPLVVVIGVVTAGLTFAAAMRTSRRLPPARRGALVASCCRFNGAFVGLPVIAMLAASQPERGDALVHVYLLHLSLLVPPSHLAAITGTIVPLQGWSGTGLRRVAGELVRNPVLQGAAVGLLLAWLAPGCLSLPGLDLVGRCLDLLGAMAVPLALIATGAAIRADHLREARRQLGVVVGVRLVVYPALVWLGCVTAGVGELATIGVVVLAGCPIAVGAVPVARELGADEAFTAAAVVVTTVMAPLTLFGWLVLVA